MRDADELQRMVLAYKGALRDANPLLGTLEDVGNVLGQTDDEGLLDAARRVAEQRDAAVARLRELELEALARREAERVYAGVCVTPAQRAQIYSDVTVRAQSEIEAWQRDITDGAPVLPGAEGDEIWRLRDEVQRWRGTAEAYAETIAALQSTPAAMPDGPGILRRWPMPGCAPAGLWISHGPDDHLEARADSVVGLLIGRWHDPGDGCYPIFVEEGRRLGEVPEDESHRHDSLMGEWFELVDGAPVLPGSSPSPDDDAYIILDGEGGIEVATTEENAIDMAVRIIDHYRDVAESDREWSEDVERVLVARVIARAVVVSREPSEDEEVDAVDYGMRRVGEPPSPADELDPVAALERVLGTRWTGDGIKHLLFIGQESVPSLQVWRAEHSRRLAGRGEQWAWYVRSITRGAHSYGHAFGRDGQVEASVACFRAISERRSVLPKSCPGLAVLTPAERAAFLEVPHV